MSNSNETDHLSQLKRALVALKKMRSRIEELERTRTEPIAIVGMSCRLPGGADDLESYWRLLRDGTDCISEVPADRWDVDAYYDPDPDVPGKMSTRWGGFLSQVDKFDPHFFGIAPREAAGMDPQHRLLLEVSWEALEHAGIAPHQLAGSPTGVFIGIATTDYSSLGLRYETPPDAYTGTGGINSIATGRLSYLLGLHGPNLAVDTACSSSLVALHLACQSLRASECRVALAGGVHVLLLPEATVYFSKLRAMAPDGRCKTFDASANGYVRGEGCGIVVLKRLSDALADRDNILAVIRGTAINHDGRSNGLTAPNGKAQEAVIRAALSSAGVQPCEIGYVEAHGTGTSLGDPIEVQALAAVLSDNRQPVDPVTVGSAKTNIGHLEAAAGIAGLIKVVLALQHEYIPPHLHLKKPNPYIPWNQIPVEIPTRGKPWLRSGRPRFAGLSSFGFSGTNAHAILEEAPLAQGQASGRASGRASGASSASSASSLDRPLHILTLSGKKEEALAESIARYTAHLTANPDTSFADLAYSANVGRSHFLHRTALVASTTEEALHRLKAAAPAARPPRPAPPKIVFLFTGQGSQYPGMGKLLYETQPVFRREIDRCDELLRNSLDRSLLSILYPEDATASPIDQTAYTQPALFAVEYALAELWRSWGIEPAAVMGHSVGEYVAACVAGVFSLEAGLKLVAERGRLMQALPAGGRMAAIMTNVQRVAAALEPYRQHVSIAAVNGPDNVVISGAGDAVERIVQNLKHDGVQAHWLTVSHAFHSPLMDGMLQEFERCASALEFRSSRITLVSNLSGTAARAAELTTAAYWRMHAREPVRFSDGMRALNERGFDTFLEIGPTPVLLSMGRRCLGENGALWLPSLRKGFDDWQQMLQTLAQLYVERAEINWAGFDAGYSRNKVVLPTYPFQRQRYWVYPTQDEYDRARSVVRNNSAINAREAVHPVLGRRLRSALKDIQFELELTPASPAILNDHRIYGHVVVPAAFHVALMMCAAAETLKAGSFVLENLTFDEALVVPDQTPQTLQLILKPRDSGAYDASVLSLSSGGTTDGWTVHATGSIKALPAQSAPSATLSFERMERIAEGEPLAASAFYERVSQIGLQLGPSFQWLENVWSKNRESFGRMRGARASDGDAGYMLPPGLIDSCFQVMGTLLVDDQCVWIPVAIDRISFFGGPALPLACHSILATSGDRNDTATGSQTLLDASGRVTAQIQNLRVRRAPRQALLRTAHGGISDLLYEVEWRHVGAVYDRPQSDGLDISGGHRPPLQAPTCLIFTDRGGVGAELAVLLESGRGTTVVRISPEDVDPANPDAFRRLIHEVTPRRIVHLWSLDATSLDQTLQCASVLHLIQAMATHRSTIVPELCVVTRGVQPIGSDRAAGALEQAPVWGLMRTIALEHSGHRCRVVDLDPNAASRVAAEALARELDSTDAEHQVALRGDGGAVRYIPRIVRSKTPPAAQPLQLRAEGSYLVTGGFGALGLRTAEWLVEKGARHLILAGRTSPSESAGAVIRKLEEAGARVKAAQIDVCDPKSVDELVESISPDTPLRGIVHCAGVLDDGVLLQLTWPRFADVLAPKVAGAWNLHTATDGIPLDFFVMFSSIASVLGAPAQANYAAANAFMDALAHERRRRGLPGVSISWGPWAGVGMASRNRASEQRWSAQGVRMLSTDSAMQVLEQMAVSGPPHVAALAVDWNQLAERPGLSQASLITDLVRKARNSNAVAAAAGPTLSEQLSTVPQHKRRPLLAAHIRDVAVKLLAGSQQFVMDPNQSLLELGMDSLMATDLRNHLQSSLGVAISPTLVFDYPTVTGIVEYLATEVLHFDPVAEAIPVDAARDEALRSAVLADIKDLSDEQVAQSIADELAKIAKGEA